MTKTIKIGSIVWVDTPATTGKGIVKHISPTGKYFWVEIAGKLYKRIYKKWVELWS